MSPGNHSDVNTKLKKWKEVSTTERQQQFLWCSSWFKLLPTSSSCPGPSGPCRRRAPLLPRPRRCPTGRPQCWSVLLGFRCEPPEAGVRSAAALPGKTSRLWAAPAAPLLPRPSDRLQENTTIITCWGHFREGNKTVALTESVICNNWRCHHWPYHVMVGELALTFTLTLVLQLWRQISG